MKLFKISSIILTSLLIVMGVSSSLEAKEYGRRHCHGHSHKHKYKSYNSSFSLNFNVDTPRYYIESERLVYPRYVQKQVIYSPRYYPQGVIVSPSLPPVVHQEVYVHPHYDYWRY